MFGLASLCRFCTCKWQAAKARRQGQCRLTSSRQPHLGSSAARAFGPGPRTGRPHVRIRECARARWCVAARMGLRPAGGTPDVDGGVRPGERSGSCTGFAAAARVFAQLSKAPESHFEGAPARKPVPVAQQMGRGMLAGGEAPGGPRHLAPQISAPSIDGCLRACPGLTCAGRTSHGCSKRALLAASLGRAPPQSIPLGGSQGHRRILGSPCLPPWISYHIVSKPGRQQPRIPGGRLQGGPLRQLGDHLGDHLGRILPRKLLT
eukprot:scaffold2995_cov430-Prasinococcus_capsulatus_cf.AAC.5